MRDPQTTYVNLLVALASRNRGDVEKYATDLLGWLNSGGKPPQVIFGYTMPEEWNGAMSRTASEEALKFARPK